jgi:hypothetical protein
MYVSLFLNNILWWHIGGMEIVYRFWHSMQVSDELQFSLLLLCQSRIWYPFSYRPSGPRTGVSLVAKRESSSPGRNQPLGVYLIASLMIKSLFHCLHGTYKTTWGKTELLEHYTSFLGLEIQDYGGRGSAALTLQHPFIHKSWH